MTNLARPIALTAVAVLTLIAFVQDKVGFFGLAIVAVVVLALMYLPPLEGALEPGRASWRRSERQIVTVLGVLFLIFFGILAVFAYLSAKGNGY
jgi:quinol-cytochrome oxidoreductase complex cytochrome b subunit